MPDGEKLRGCAHHARSCGQLASWDWWRPITHHTSADIRAGREWGPHTKLRRDAKSGKGGCHRVGCAAGDGHDITAVESSFGSVEDTVGNWGEAQECALPRSCSVRGVRACNHPPPRRPPDLTLTRTHRPARHDTHANVVKVVVDISETEWHSSWWTTRDRLDWLVKQVTTQHMPHMITGRPLPPPCLAPTEPVSTHIPVSTYMGGGGRQTNQPTPPAHVDPVAMLIGRRFTTERFFKARRPSARGSVIATSSNLHTSPHPRRHRHNTSELAHRQLHHHLPPPHVLADAPQNAHRVLRRENITHTSSSAPSKSTHLHIP